MLFWSLNDLKLLKKIFQLIEAFRKILVEGLGKPEASMKSTSLFTKYQTAIVIHAAHYHYK